MKTSKLLIRLFILIAFLGLNEVMGQWLYNGTSIYNSNSGNVGIGTNSPGSLLYVGKSMTEPTITIRNMGGSGGATYNMIDDASGANWKFKATNAGGFKIRDNANSKDVVVIEPNSGFYAIHIGQFGHVGINKITQPDDELDVNGDAQIQGYAPFLTFDDTANTHAGLCFKNDGEYRAWIYYDEPDQLLRFSANQSGIANDALVVKYPNLVGVGTATPGARLEVRYSPTDHIYLGYSDIRQAYILNKQMSANGDGQSGLHVTRDIDESNTGTDYTNSTSNHAIVGYNAWGDHYSFALFGYGFNDYSRSGAVIGTEYFANYWGALGYKSSSSSSYGGYFTSYTSGAGKAPSSAQTGIGIGAWGDLFGADIHGKVYGIYAEGENYACFSNGDVYKNKLDIHLQANPGGSNDVLYTNVSADVTVMTSGTAMLTGGKASVSFDPVFASAVSKDAPIVITITPIGESNGIHLTETTSAGFSMAENNSGKSNITVNYIAVGKRAGYENPVLAKEVIDPSYNSKLSRGLHADTDTQTEGEGLYYENGQLVVGVHSSLLPDPNRIAEMDMPEPPAAKPGEPAIADDMKPEGPGMK
jgi:hypothetical protein